MESLFERQLFRMIDFALVGSRGGPMRLRIMGEISKRPMNTNELSKSLGIDYKTTEYHLRVLKQNNIVVEGGDKYGSKFSPSQIFKRWEKVHKLARTNKK